MTGVKRIIKALLAPAFYAMLAVELALLAGLLTAYWMWRRMVECVTGRTA